MQQAFLNLSKQQRNKTEKLGMPGVNTLATETCGHVMFMTDLNAYLSTRGSKFKRLFCT